MPYDYIPPHIALPLALIFWSMLLWMVFKTPIKTAVDEFFAARRQRRRELNKMRAYAAMDAKATTDIFWSEDHLNTR